jgi:hypothetical protein
MTNEADMHPAIVGILQHFTYDHLPPALQNVSRPICELAHDVAVEFTSIGSAGAEVTVGLRKLLEAKDCFVRAAVAEQAARARQEQRQ